MKIKNIFLVALLIALAISLGFNYLLFEQVQTLSNKYDNNFAMVLKIDVYHDGIWKNALYKTGDLLKYNFGNLTMLWAMSRGSSDTYDKPQIKFVYLAVWRYSLQNYTAGNGYYTNQGSCNLYVFTANDLINFNIYFWGQVPPTSRSGSNVYKVPFIIGFGNSTAPFGTFPSLAHNTNININFGYKGNNCAEASHEGADATNGVASQNVNRGNNRIFLNYTGYWTNSYSTAYSIVYTRLYIPLVIVTNVQGQWYVTVFWLLVAEDSFTAVTLNSGDIVRITYSLQINP